MMTKAACTESMKLTYYAAYNTVHINVKCNCLRHYERRRKSWSHIDFDKVISRNYKNASMKTSNIPKYIDYNDAWRHLSISRPATAKEDSITRDGENKRHYALMILFADIWGEIREIHNLLNRNRNWWFTEMSHGREKSANRDFAVNIDAALIISARGVRRWLLHFFMNQWGWFREEQSVNIYCRRYLSFRDRNNIINEIGASTLNMPFWCWHLYRLAVIDTFGIDQREWLDTSAHHEIMRPRGHISYVGLLLRYIAFTFHFCESPSQTLALFNMVISLALLLKLPLARWLAVHRNARNPIELACWSNFWSAMIIASLP